MAMQPMRLCLLAAVLAAHLLPASALAPALADGQTCLSELERKVETDHAGVRSLLPQQFSDMLRQGEDVIILDVRDKSEFNVSRIPGAVHVEPGISTREFRTRFRDVLAGKTVLLYCSVGVRSSRLAQRIEAVAREAGAKGAYNLRGGVFAWHNYGKQLAEDRGGTDLVHPYGTSWSRYLDFPELATYGRR